ncbi:hypothetical protein GFM44_30900 [Rhizobium leguminosarum bv. viciae]|nr:hypothetical protein [Rhizobium leguminosarum bv. viciae]
MAVGTEELKLIPVVNKQIASSPSSGRNDRMQYALDTAMNADGTGSAVLMSKITGFTTRGSRIVIEVGRLLKAQSLHESSDRIALVKVSLSGDGRFICVRYYTMLASRRGMARFTLHLS